MARRTFVHIGLPKTGTTYLQTMMWRNRSQLRDQRFLYPGSSRFDHYHAQRILRGKRPDPDNVDAWDRVRDKLTSWDGDGLFSHEFLCLATPRQIGPALQELQPTEVHVIVTVRDLVRQVPALWQQTLKMHYGESFDEFTAAALAGRRPGPWGLKSQDVPAILDRWTKVVPASRIHVITTPPPGAPRGLLWERWCQALGIDDSGFDFGGSLANESLGAAQAALLLRVKPYLTGDLSPGPVRHRWVRKYFGHEVLVPQQGERFGVRPEHVAQLRKLSLATKHYLETHDVDVIGDTDELIPDESLAALPHPDDVSPEEQLDVAAAAIAHMIGDVRNLTMRNEELMTQLTTARETGETDETGETEQGRSVWQSLRMRLVRR